MSFQVAKLPKLFGPLSFGQFLSMTKPTVSLLVIITAVPTMIMAAQGFPSPSLFLATALGIFLSSSAAAIFNQVVDFDIDLKMQRTRKRPLPSASMTKPQALTLAVLLTAASMAILLIWSHPLAALVTLLANAFYVLVYTIYLKHRTTQNIVIGGAAGAVGPLIGWAAVTGQLSWEAWILFAIVFFWTPSHFWALAIKYKDDYAAANVPMLPVVKGIQHTKIQIFLYSLTLIPPVLALYMGRSVGEVFFIPAFLLTIVYIWKCLCLLTGYREQTPMQVFHYSCFYLFAVFAILTIDQIVLYG